MVVKFHTQLCPCDISTHIYNFFFFCMDRFIPSSRTAIFPRCFYRHVTISDTACHISSSICQNFIVFMTPKFLNGTREKESKLGLCMQTKRKKMRFVLSWYNNVTGFFMGYFVLNKARWRVINEYFTVFIFINSSTAKFLLKSIVLLNCTWNIKRIKSPKTD